MVAAFAVILYLSRGMALSPDEVSWFLTTPQLSPREALEPYGGALLATTRVVYWALFEVFGAGYLPFRILAAATVLLTVGVFYAYASKAIGRVAALAPSLVLLFFGPDALHVLAGNTFTVLLPIACGICALLAVDRGDRRGDVAACVLLCLAVVTYSTGLAVTVGVAVAILWRADRWRRAWIVLVPIGIYVAWWLWARTSTEAGSGVVVSNALLIPAWGFESLGAIASSMVGLNYRFSGAPEPIQAGAPLALVALVGLGWRFWKGPLPEAFWPALAAILALWTLQALAADGADNYPSSPHYLFPVTLVALLAVVQAARGVRWTGALLLVVFAVAAVALATNASVLRQRAAEFRYDYSPQARAAFTGLDVAGPSADPTFAFEGLALNPGLYMAFRGVGARPTDDYRIAIERYGSPGYTLPDLPEGGPASQARAAAIADSVLVASLDLGIEPRPGDAGPTGCRRLQPGTAGSFSFSLAPGDAVLVAGAAGPVTVRRFAAASTTQVAVATPGVPFVFRVPPDRAPDRLWQATVSGSAVRLCNA